MNLIENKTAASLQATARYELAKSCGVSERHQRSRLLAYEYVRKILWLRGLPCRGVIPFPNGDTYTLDQLIDRAMNRYYPWFYSVAK